MASATSTACFDRILAAGHQVEEPDPWLRGGHPWEIERSEYEQAVHFRGHVEHYLDDEGRRHARWINTHDVLAVPFDIPVPGYHNGTVNTLRLWSAVATDEFDLDEFNAGSYTEAVAARTAAENITMVLYPNDASENGKELRLRQQYFLASASLKDVMRQWGNRHGENFDDFADKHCFQLNDTHPSIAVAELMRLLIDVHGLEWDARLENHQQLHGLYQSHPTTRGARTLAGTACSNNWYHGYLISCAKLTVALSRK